MNNPTRNNFKWLLLPVLLMLLLVGCGNREPAAEEYQYCYLLESDGGFDGDDLKAIRKIRGADVVEGVFCADMSVNVGDRTVQTQIHSVSQKLGILTVTQGRLPENSDEAAVDAAFFRENGLALGDRILLDETAVYAGEVSVVGVVETAWQIRPGIYLTPDSFRADGFTRVYVILLSEERAQSVGQALEAMAPDRQQARFEALQQQLETGVQEQSKLESMMLDPIKDELDSAYAQLEDARQALEEGRRELSDGEKKLRDAKDELERTKKELDEGEVKLREAEQKLNDGEAELADAKKELDRYRSELSDARATLQSSRKELDDNWAEFRKVLEEYNLSEDKLESAQLELIAGIQAAENGLTQIKDLLAQADAGLQTLEAEADDVRKQIDKLGKTLMETPPSDIRTRLELTAQIAALSARAIVIQTQVEQIRAQRDQILAQKPQVEAQLSQLLSQKAGVDQLIEARGKLQDGEAEYRQAASELSDAEALLSEKNAEYTRGLNSLNDGKAEYQASKEKYESGYDLYRQGLADYSAGLREYESQKSKFNEKETEFLEAEAEYKEAEQAFLEKQSEMDSELAVLQDRLDLLTVPCWTITSMDI